MIKQRIILPIFKKTLSLLSGHGLRKYKFLQSAKEHAISSLKSDFAMVQGHKMYLGSKDSLQLSIKGIYEEVETGIVKNQIKKDDIVLDIGANIGYYTLIFANLVGKKGKVFAFEPEPSNFAILQKNIELNNYDNVILEQKAIGDENKMIKLFLSEIRTGMHRIYKSKYTKDNFVNVEMVKLDDYFASNQLSEKINFIKIDVEGSEEGVLFGLQKILETNKKIGLLLEFVPDSIKEYGSDPENIMKFLLSLNFKILATDDQNKTTIPITSYGEFLTKFPKGTNLFCTKKL